MGTEEKASFYGPKNAVALFIIYMASLGFAFYGFVVVFPAMLKATGWGRGDAALAHTIRGIIVGFLAPVVAILINKFGSRKTLMIGLGIMLVGLSLLSFAVTELWQWIVVWGFVMPFGFAFGGIIPVQTTITFWFSRNRATVFGIVMTSAAIAGFIASPLYTYIMQSFGSWQTGWLTAALIIVIALIAALFIKDKPEDIGQHVDGISPEEAKAAADAGTAKPIRTYRTPVTWTVQEAIRNKSLWFIFICFLAQLMPLYLVTVHGVLHFIDGGMTRMQAGTVIGFLILGSGVARFPMGFLADRIEPRWILAGAYVLMLATIMFIWKSTSVTALMIAGPLFGFGYGTTIVMVPAIIANYYGPTSYASINGFLYPFMILIGATVPVGGGYIADITGSYNLAFLIITCIIVAGMVFAFLLAPPTKKEEAAA